MPRSHPAATRHNQPRLRPPTHTPPPNGGFCTIRRTATACRTPNAAIPPHSPAPTATSDGLPGHTRSPARSATALRATPRRPNGGFCTIRRIATACRRRVAALMLQFPPFARARTTATPSSAPPSPLARASNATPPQPRPHGAASPAAPGCNAPTTNRNLARRATPGRLPAQPPLSGPHPAAQRGVCTIRRIATACRRRVAPLMVQFPPHTTPATAPTATSDGSPAHAPPRTPATTRLATAHPAASPAAPGHARSPARPATALRATPRRPTGGFAPLDTPLRRVAGVSHP